MLCAVLVAIALLVPATYAWAGDIEDCANEALLKSNPDRVVSACRRTAEQGDAAGEFTLGSLYAKGEGVPQQYREAVKWFRKAADQGYPLAQNKLGLMYDYGLGVPQDYKEAMKWFHRAAEQGDDWSQLNLGYMYAKGQGVERDFVQAYLWCSLAAASFPPGSDHDDAVKMLNPVAPRMTSEELAEAKRLVTTWIPRTSN